MKKRILLFISIIASALTAQAQNYQMKVVKNDGKVETFATKDVKEVLFECVEDEKHKQKEPEYIEIAGAKWAKGNLMYDNGTWKIADNQWEYFNKVYGKQRELNRKCTKSDTQIDHFNFGVCGTNALTEAEIAVKCGDKFGPTSISGMMFKDAECKQPTDNYEDAAYGDLAFWATKGMWKLPSKTNWARLQDEADWQLGYITLDNGKQIYGCLFTPTKSEFGVGITLPREITKEEVEKYLFLPMAGYRNGKAIENAGFGGYYWADRSFSEDYNSYLEVSFDFDGIYYHKNGTTVLDNGNCIRPVLAK